jgi:(p)ppGpp synthase/HD superfamily hydrolase
MHSRNATANTFTRRLPRTEGALAFAQERHAGQRREVDDAPFVTHPLEVALMLDEAGYPDHVVAAGVLHDVLERTDAEPQEVAALFGTKVSMLVSAVTENPSIEDAAERKAALRRQVSRAGDAAAAVFAADKVSKAREIRLRASRGQLDAERDCPRIEHYEESLAMLEELLSGHHLVEALRRELEAVHALPCCGA